MEDPKRGLFNDQAWQRRTAKSRFTKGFQDTSGPVIQLETLTKAEIMLLLQRLTAVHASHYGTQKPLTDQELQDFMQEIVNRLGAEALLTPGEIVRDFISVLNILQQNPEMSLNELTRGSGLPLAATSKNSALDQNGEVAEFTL